ncbi:MAG: asparagine synthase (glutamine-hydrolyzing), partial [Caldithrix sp. RBG_13_44_9]
MCGIVALYRYQDKSSFDLGLFQKMIGSLAHRGPDDNGQFVTVEDGIYLGHRRLSIIDLSTGHQPMTNEDGSIWISYNGEIYNFLELRQELTAYGHIFKTRSDTEVIIHAYEQWGSEAFSRLNGMFALVLWDGNKKELLAARDPFGIKPLYYWQDARSLLLASEIKTLFLYPDIKRKIDPGALADFLALTYVPSPRTAFSSIYKLPPGHLLCCNSSGIKISRFYQQVPVPQEKKSEDELVEELRSRIFQAVKRQLIADVPVGAMLSGGVDSSTLVTIMAQLTEQPVKTFTVGFEGDFKENEFTFAREIARCTGSLHQDITVTLQDYIQLLPQSVWHMEEPVATGSILAYYLVCKLASQSVKVVLTGQGADEPFAGYPRHLGEYYGRFYRRLPAGIRRYLIGPTINLLPRNERLKRAIWSLGISDPVERMQAIYHTIDLEMKKNLLRSDIATDQASLLYQVIKNWQVDVSDLDDLNQLLYVDSRLSLADNLLLYGDKMSMAVSLEARVPYLDLELMKFVEGLPAKYKIRGLTQKYLLKRAVEKWIPRDFIRRKKVGFSTPLDNWFQKELAGTIKEVLLSPGSGCREYLNQELIAR